MSDDEEVKDRDVERLRDIAAKLAEHFPDFLVLARCDDKGFIWKQSDPTWGIGACERYTSILKDQALIERLRAMEGD